MNIKVEEKLMDNKTYTVKEVAKILNIGESTVRELIRQGKLKKLPISKPIRIAQSAINEFTGLPIQTSPASKNDEITFMRKEIMELITATTDIQQSTNRLLVLLQHKLK